MDRPDRLFITLRARQCCQPRMAGPARLYDPVGPHRQKPRIGVLNPIRIDCMGAKAGFLSLLISNF